MIERLNQLSLAQFIELSCGDNSVLLEENENASEKEMKQLASRFILEYRTLMNPTGVKAIMAEKENALKIDARIFLLKLCKSLCILEGYEQVREALKESLPANLTDDRLKKAVENMLHEAEFYKKRTEDMAVADNPAINENAIRASFDSEIAFVMTYFKMQIDIHTINAAVYANIVQRANTEIRLRTDKTPYSFYFHPLF